MQQHTINLWYCFPITITKADLEGEGLLRVLISPVNHDKSDLFDMRCYRSQLPPYSHFVSSSQIMYVDLGFKL